MTDPLVDKVEVVPVEGHALPGDDTVFVAVHGAGHTGWYGPVSEAVGRAVEAISSGVAGAPVMDHRGLPGRLRAVANGIAAGMREWAAGAIDCALWDLHGRLIGRPVAALLSSAGERSAVPAYASWLQLDLGGPAEPGALERVLSEGWTLTKWGLRRRPGLNVVAEAGRLAEAVERAAGIIGGNFAVDAVGTWNPRLATAFADLVDQPTLAWLEDPLPEHQLHVYRRLALAGMPVAVGERLGPDEDLHRLLEQVHPAALTIDVVGCGGLTRAVEITTMARRAGIPVYPHGRSMVPGIHLAAAFPDTVPAVEYRRQWEPRRQHLYAEPWTPRHGQLPAPEAPGLGTRPRRPQ